MCRLGGVALGTASRSREFYRMLSKELIELLVEMDVAQGGDGVGVSIHYPDGSYRLFKSPERAWDFYRHHWEQIEEALPGAVAVQMHARLATQGDSHNPVNLHPIERGPVVGAHNGIIVNDDEIFKGLELERHGEVDSEAIFAAIEAVCPDMRLDHLQIVLDLLQGSYAFTVATSQVPGKVWLVAGNGELCYARDKARNLVWWASTSLLLPKSARRNGTVRLDVGDVIVIHANEPKVRVELHELNVPPRRWYYYDDYGYDGWGLTEENFWKDDDEWWTAPAGRAAGPLPQASSYAEWDRQVSQWESRQRRRSRSRTRWARR